MWPKTFAASRRSDVDEIRVELRRPPSLGERDRGVDAADAVGDLGELRQLHDPRRERDLVAGQLAGPAAAVPTFVRAAERVEHRLGKTELCAQLAGECGVTGHHVAHLSVAGDRELEASAEPVQRRASPTRSGAPCATTSRTLNGSWSYFVAFRAMSSPNHFACSWASEWQPTLTSRAV